jgi:hypothetical protein
LPVPQLFRVPRVRVPVVEYLVTISALPRATPLTDFMGVSGVMRRLKLEALS